MQNLSKREDLQPPPSPFTGPLLQAKLNNGKYLIPSAQNTTSAPNAGTNVFLQQPAIFKADEASAALDYNLNSRKGYLHISTSTPRTLSPVNATRTPSGFPRGRGFQRSRVGTLSKLPSPSAHASTGSSVSASPARRSTQHSRRCSPTAPSVAFPRRDVNMPGVLAG